MSGTMYRTDFPLLINSLIFVDEMSSCAGFRTSISGVDASIGYPGRRYTMMLASFSNFSCDFHLWK